MDDFFDIASSARAQSAAEALGLAPLTAHEILIATGGDLTRVKGAQKTGYLEARLQLQA